MKREETNKLIAEFMGVYQDDKGCWGFTNTKEHHRWHTDRFLDATHYDTDWNWLMEVVEKIESLGNYINITGTYTSIGAIEQKNRLFFIEKDSLNNKIEAVYKAVVEFIKWYNKNAVKS